MILTSKLSPHPSTLESVSYFIIKHVSYILLQIMLADVWLYTTLELARTAFPDAMEITCWVGDFTTKFESDSKIKKYLASRQPAPM